MQLTFQGRPFSRPYPIATQAQYQPTASARGIGSDLFSPGISRSQVKFGQIGESSSVDVDPSVWKKLTPNLVHTYILSHYGRGYILEPDVIMNKELIDYILTEKTVGGVKTTTAKTIAEQHYNDFEAGVPLRIMEMGNGGVMQFLFIYELLRQAVCRDLDELRREKLEHIYKDELAKYRPENFPCYDDWVKSYRNSNPSQRLPGLSSSREDDNLYLLYLQASRGWHSPPFPEFEDWRLNYEKEHKFERKKGTLDLEIVLAEPKKAFRQVTLCTLNPTGAKEIIKLNKAEQFFQKEKFYTKADDVFDFLQQLNNLTFLYTHCFRNIWDKFGQLTSDHFQQWNGIARNHPRRYASIHLPKTFVDVIYPKGLDNPPTRWQPQLVENRYGKTNIKVVKAGVNTLKDSYPDYFHFGLAPYSIGSITSDRRSFIHDLFGFQTPLKEGAPYAILAMQKTENWPMGSAMLANGKDVDTDYSIGYLSGIPRVYKSYLQFKLDADAASKKIIESNPILPAYPVGPKELGKLLDDINHFTGRVAPMDLKGYELFREHQNAKYEVKIKTVKDSVSVREGAHGMILATGRVAPLKSRASEDDT